MMAVELQFPPGFRFHPTDEELVMHYLCRKCASQQIAVPIIKEIDLYKYDPWDLPVLAVYGEKEWYFFTTRDRKYPNGSRPNRAAGSGYWKATGADKTIGHPKAIGIKKALVFYAGKALKGDKTNWIMHEYRLAGVNRSVREKNNSLGLDDWVLCRIYNKKGTLEKNNAGYRKVSHPMDIEEKKPKIMTPETETSPVVFGDLGPLDPSDSVPRLHTDSSCSEHVVSTEITWDREVQSQPKLEEWKKSALDFSFNYVDATVNNNNYANAMFGSQMLPLQDMFLYLQRPC